MAPAYKFTYFDGKGVGEASRYVLKYAGIDFEDVRVKLEDWPKVKETTPFGQLPILEHNGKKVNQSLAICRYLGKIAKIAGNDDWENLEIDAVVDTISDLRIKCMMAQFEKDEAKQKTLKETALKETLPYYLTRLDATVGKNNGHLALGRLTWADFYFAGVSGAFNLFVGGNAFEKYPNLKALIAKVEALPAIKKWIEVRPKTDY